MHTDLVEVGDAIAALVALVLQVDRVIRVALAEQVPLLALVTGGDELLQSKPFEVVAEVVEEVRNARIIRVAVDDLAPEVLPVVPELTLDVGESRVELVLLGFPRVTKIPVVPRGGGRLWHLCRL